MQLTNNPDEVLAKDDCDLCGESTAGSKRSELREGPVKLNARIGELVLAAMHLTQAEGAALAVMEAGEASLGLRHGESPAFLSISNAELTKLMEAEILASASENRERLQGPGGLAPGVFFAVVPFKKDGKPVGALLICDSRPFALSAAQESVLRTLAAEIGDQIEFQRLRIAREQDRTRLVAATERLRLLESVVVHANDAVLITEAEPIDLPGPRILYANAAFLKTTGYSLEEVLGKTPRMLQGPETDRAPLQMLKEALRAWRPTVVELMNYRKDGSTFWVELSIVPVADETGCYTHWVSVQRDVSLRKEAEADLVRLQRAAETRNEALAHEIAQRASSERKLAHAAYHDNLTGLCNRAYFTDKLRGSVLRAKQDPDYRCALLFMDLDGFKEVNDRFGHGAGDLLLVEVASRLKGSSRAQDTIARMGGDEFTVLLDKIGGMGEVVGIVERILESLTAPISLSGKNMVLGASIGLCLGSYSDPEHMLRDADTAMYVAKQAGGSRYSVFSPEMHEHAMAVLDTRSELRIALEKQQFELHYQPLVDLETQQMCGVEALVRWRHPERGLIPPLSFIGVAEETGLIVPLGSWVLHQACEHLSRWRETMPAERPFKMSVNVSPLQLQDETFLADLQGALHKAGIRPVDLQLEVTEGVLLNNPERVGALLKRIRQLGVRIACDDFGTGYSSLSYLELYPIDIIKIDQSFVKKLHLGHSDIVRMIIGLAHALRMQVSAEGVENLQQQELLLDLGCREFQGYLYSKPVGFDAMTNLLRQELSLAAFDSSVCAGT